MFLARTIQDILEHAKGDTEIIAVLDGQWADPPIPMHPKVSIIYHAESIGQRAAMNEAAKISTGKYIMKCDAHCAFDDGFDVKLIEDMQPDWTVVPVMRNLHAFDWVCPNGHRRYQGNSGVCETCGKDTQKDVVWIPKTSPQSFSFRFDKTMHFQYYGEYKSKQVGELVETMSIQGSCFMATKEKWFELDLCSEEFHSWGQQGVEVACKTWLSGGSVICNKRTWYAHMFRTKGGDFGFPYHNPQDKVKENRELSRELFQKDKWSLAKRKFKWLLDKFNPPDWTITTGLIYYTDNQLDEKYAKPARESIQKGAKERNFRITTGALKKKLDWGHKNISFPTLKRSFYAMHKQILACLENTSDDIIFFTEADVIYHPSHFDFIPKEKDTFYYNRNVWMLRTPDGHALHYEVDQLSGLCVYKETALIHSKERFKLEEDAFN
jgi:glycosyltransferase involved in cell wall biosynthesis